MTTSEVKELLEKTGNLIGGESENGQVRKGPFKCKFCVGKEFPNLNVGIIHYDEQFNQLTEYITVRP